MPHEPSHATSSASPTHPAPNPFAPPQAAIDLREKKSSKLLPHHRAGRVIRLMGWLGLVGVIGIAASILLPVLSTGRLPPFEFSVILFVAAGFVTGLFFVAAAVMRHETWGRFAGIAYGTLSLLGFPLGTLIGLYILWQLVLHWDEADEADDAGR